MNTEKLNENQEKANLETVTSLERTGQFSGVAFSLSLTLLGYILSKGYLISILNSVKYLKIVLIIGWAFLGLSVITSLLPRIFNAKLLFFASWNAYLKQFTMFASEKLHTQHTDLVSKSDRKTDSFSILLRRSIITVYAGAIIGILCLVLFTIGLIVSVKS